MLQETSEGGAEVIVVTTAENESDAKEEYFDNDCYPLRSLAVTRSAGRRCCPRFM